MGVEVPEEFPSEKLQYSTHVSVYTVQRIPKKSAYSKIPHGKIKAPVHVPLRRGTYPNPASYADPAI